MYDVEIFVNAKEALENCRGIRQFFTALPEGTELSVDLDGRLPCTLVRREDGVELQPHPAKAADIEFILFSESIRRLREVSPDDILSLAKEISSLTLSGHIKTRLLSPLVTLYSKGYLNTLRNYGPELQKDLQKYAFIFMGEAAQAIEKIKGWLSK